MRKLFYLLYICLMAFACNDGDIIEVGLDFDQTLAFCDQSSTTYLLYDTKTDPFESLSLVFPRNTTNDLIFSPTESPYEYEFDINASTVRFNYRTYNGNPENLLCQLVPDPNTNIINDYEATSGTVTTTTTFVDDDEDGIPSNVEDLNSDGDDNPATNPTDSDLDGIPDYKDADDDNDNILTKNEKHNYTVADGLTNAQNTDLNLPNGDMLPDYLDADDDGDGTLTRLEDEDGDLSPLNDFDEGSTMLDIARYLDPTATAEFPSDVFVENTYKRTVIVNFLIKQINLQILSTDVVEFGDYQFSITKTGL